MAQQDLVKKWEPVLEAEGAPTIADSYKKKVIAQLCENTIVESRNNQEILSEDAAPVNVTGNIAKYDPILISMVRRAMPNLIAYDICGVQAMTGPTGLIFAMRPKYVQGTALGADAFYKEANTAFSGAATPAHSGSMPDVLTTGNAMATADGEKLGSDTGSAFAEMGFEIEKVMVEAKTRALKAKYSVELAQDMKALHGLDAETELATILSTEILAEINREIIRTMYNVAKPGAQTGTTAAGTFDLDLDSNGRWSVEKFKGMMFQIEREANQIAKETRRGKGNFIVCSSDVASALAMAGILDNNPALQNGLQVDDTGNTFAGVLLNGKFKVYVDPYATGDYFMVGYKGVNSYDAGMFYAPYVPLQMYKTMNDETFQPKLGFKTRYGLVANPFAHGIEKGNGALVANKNVYFRKVKVANIL
jgi:hypothetical protein